MMIENPASDLLQSIQKIGSNLPELPVMPYGASLWSIFHLPCFIDQDWNSLSANLQQDVRSDFTDLVGIDHWC